MKLFSLPIAFMVAANIAQADEDREFTSKTLQPKFETSADAHKWSLRNLGLKEWLDAVSKPEWAELHKSETNEFYFAIFRSENHLIFCENDRKDTYKRAATSLKATNDAIGFAVAERPSISTTLKWNVVNPSGGGTSGQKIFQTWKIKDEFSGEILLDYSIGNEGIPYRQVFHQTVSWTEKQNNVTVQPATQEPQSPMNAAITGAREFRSKNNEQLPKALSDEVLDVLNRFTNTFKPSERDCRVPEQGPMAALEPLHVASFITPAKEKASIELYVFSEKYSVLQISINSKVKKFFSSTDKELIGEFSKIMQKEPQH